MALLDNLVSYWRLNEASGTRVDANNEALLGPSEGGLDFGDADFTVSGWVKLANKSTEQIIIGRWGVAGDSERGYVLEYNQAEDDFRVLISANGSTFVSLEASDLGSPSVDTWYMVTFYHSATDNEVGINVNTGLYITGPHNLGINASPGVRFKLASIDDPAAGGADLDGSMDGWGVWSRILTTDELTTLYNGGAGLDYPFGESLADPQESDEQKTAIDAPSASLSAQFVPIHTHLQINRPDDDSGAHAYTILYREEDA
jgi:hypothetical protein